MIRMCVFAIGYTCFYIYNKLEDAQIFTRSVYNVLAGCTVCF